MNQMGLEIEHMLHYQNVSISDISTYRTAVWLAQSPRKVKGQKDYMWPDKAMLALLDAAAIKEKL